MKLKAIQIMFMNIKGATRDVVDMSSRETITNMTAFNKELQISFL